MKTIKVAGCGVLGLWSLLAVMGCGGVTQELGDVAGSSSGGTAGSGGKASSAGGQPSNAAGSGGGSASNAGSSPCETQCVQKILSGPTKCALCHQGQPSPNGLQSSGLDLQSPNVTARLKDVLSKHTDLPPPNNICPTGDRLIDSSNPEQSWLLKKLKGQQGTCGDRMPQTGVIPAADLACLETYVYCVAAQ